VLLVKNTNVQHKVRVNLSEGASDNHSWQKESSWDICTVSNDGEEVPHAPEDDHLRKRTHDTLAQNISNQASFCLPKDGSKGVKFIFILAPSLIDIVFFF
jgi:hypothetical protein